MIVITICVGSSCHIKGSRQVVERLQELVKEHNVSNKVELKGAFCMGHCQQGVCVKIGENLFSLNEKNVDEFFKENVLNKI